MPDFKNMIKGMKEQETPETPTQEETEKAGKLADSGFKIGEHRFIGKDNNKTNPGFIAYGGNNPDQKLSTKELAKIYDEQQKAKSVSPEQDRLTKLKKDAIAESQSTAKKEAPLAKRTVGEDLSDLYEKEFFKQANGNKEDFVNHFINRFGVPRGSSKKREMEHYSKRFDELMAKGGAKENNLLMGLTPEQRQAHYERIFKENDANDEIFGGKGRAYGDLTDLYNGYDIPKGQPFDENLTDEHNKKMLEEFDDYVQQRGWYPEKGKEKYPDKARRGEEDIMAEYRNIKQDDIPEAIRQLEEKQKTAKTDEEWERYDEQARLLRRDWEENYGREPEDNDTPTELRLLDPTDTFTQKELDDYAEYINVAEEPDGYYIKKMDDGNYLTNVKADLSSIPTGDAHDAEPTVVSPSQLGEILREHLQNSPELSDYLYEFTSDRARRETAKGLQDKARKAWEEHLKYALADQTDENIEKGNRTAEEFGDIVWPYLNEKEKDEFDTIAGTYKDPQEVWDYLADIFGWQK